MISGLVCFAALTISISSLVEMWQSTSFVPWVMASSRALMLERMQAWRLRMAGCWSNGMSSPYFSVAAARLALIMASSSQCTSTGFSLILKRRSREFLSSTSMLPVDEPMKTLTPGMSLAFSPVAGSPSLTRLQIWSALELLAPMWKPILARLRPLASCILPARASALMVAGLVLGMSKTVVTPPATAARDSVCMSALWVRPGSRKWTWASMPPAMMYLPWRSMASSVISGTWCRSSQYTLLMLSPSMRMAPLPSFSAVTMVAL